MWVSIATRVLSKGPLNTIAIEYFLRISMEPVNATLPTTGNETLDELNFRYAQSLLPFAVLLGVFCLIGIVGNSVVIMVFLYSKEYRNTNFKIFVLCLAAVDLMSCVTLMPAEIVKTRHYFSINDHIPCKVKCFFNIFSMTAYALIFLVICVDRYRKVCQPLKKQIWPGMATKILNGALLASIIFSVPAPIMCGVTEHMKTNLYGANITTYVCSAERRYQSSVVRYVYKFCLSILLVVIAVALIVMYVMIMKTVIQHMGNRDSGDTIRFDTGRNHERSDDKVEVDRITENEDVFVNLKTAEGEAHVHAHLKVHSGGSQMNRKTNDDKKRSKGFSINSMFSFKGRFSTRSSSVVSFRSRVKLRRSSSVAAGKLPYKTLIWFILTLIFLVTFIINAGLSFIPTKENSLSPTKLFWFLFLFRIYFVNNIINPVIYASLDRRFKKSFKLIVADIQGKICRK